MKRLPASSSTFASSSAVSSIVVTTPSVCSSPRPRAAYHRLAGRRSRYSSARHRWSSAVPASPASDDVATGQNVGMTGHAGTGGRVAGWSDGPLVGRDDLIDELYAAAGAAAQGDGSIVLLTGEAGIGKTSVARALA